MENKQTGHLYLSGRAVKTTEQGNVEEGGCKGDGVGRVIRDGSLEAMI